MFLPCSHKKAVAHLAASYKACGRWQLCSSVEREDSMPEMNSWEAQKVSLACPPEVPKKRMSVGRRAPENGGGGVHGSFGGSVC